MGGIAMKKKYFLFIAVFILCLGKNVYASDGIDNRYFNSLVNHANTIEFNDLQVAEEEYLESSVAPCGTVYKFYVPTTLNVTVTVTYDQKSDQYANVWLMDINNEHLINEMNINEGKRNGANNNVTCSKTFCLNPGYYILAVHTRWTLYSDGAKTYTKITGTLPTKPSVAKLKKQGKKSAVLKWNRINSVTGYQVYRRTGTFGKYSKVKTLNSTSFVNKKLKKNKTYYYKVRAYQNIGGTVFYSPFSSAKKIKMK